MRTHCVPEVSDPSPVGLVQFPRVGATGRNVENIAAGPAAAESGVGVGLRGYFPSSANVGANEMGDLFFGTCSPMTVIAASQR